MMIWRHRQTIFPSGMQTYDVELEGHTWEVWQATVHGWNYVAYVAVGSVDEVDINLMSFINDAIDNGIIEPEWSLEAMEAGFEIVAQGEGLRSLGYSASVEPK